MCSLVELVIPLYLYFIEGYGIGSREEPHSPIEPIVDAMQVIGFN
jgi:hypothetical protein